MCPLEVEFILFVCLPVYSHESLVCIIHQPAQNIEKDMISSLFNSHLDHTSRCIFLAVQFKMLMNILRFANSKRSITFRNWTPLAHLQCARIDAHLVAAIVAGIICQANCVKCGVASNSLSLQHYHLFRERTQSHAMPSNAMRAAITDLCITIICLTKFQSKSYHAASGFAATEKCIRSINLFNGNKSSFFVVAAISWNK